MELGDEVPGGLGSGPDELVDRGGRVEVRREAVVGHAVDDRGRAARSGGPRSGGTRPGWPSADRGRPRSDSARRSGRGPCSRPRDRAASSSAGAGRGPGPASVGWVTTGQLGSPARGQHRELGPGAGQDRLRGPIAGAQRDRALGALDGRGVPTELEVDLGPEGELGRAGVIRRECSRSRAAAPVAPISSVARASRTVPDRRVRGSRATRSA